MSSDVPTSKEVSFFVSAWPEMARREREGWALMHRRWFERQTQGLGLAIGMCMSQANEHALQAFDDQVENFHRHVSYVRAYLEAVCLRDGR